MPPPRSAAPSRRARVARPAERAAGPTASRARLLAAAADALVANHGALEMADVARRARASVGLAYHYFGSKAGLLSAVVADFYDRYDAVVNRRLRRDTPWWVRERQRTADVVRFHYDEPLAPLVLGRLAAAPEVAAVAAERLGALVRRGARNIAIGQSRGEVSRDLDPELAAAFVLGGVRQTLAAALAREPRLPRDAVAREAWSLVANAVQALEASR